MGRTKLDDRTPLDADSRPEKVKARPKAKGKPEPKPNPVTGWAYAGVGLTLSLSGWLNGLAFSQSAPTPVHGWVLGVAIPVLVLVFSRVSAVLYAQGNRHLAYCGAGATLSILLLSVQHCAVSIARLTGEPVALAALMALSIDVGLVVAEVASVGVKKIRSK
jgi:hypothetical protein